MKKQRNILDRFKFFSSFTSIMPINEELRKEVENLRKDIDALKYTISNLMVYIIENYELDDDEDILLLQRDLDQYDLDSFSS